MVTSNSLTKMVRSWVLLWDLSISQMRVQMLVSIPRPRRSQLNTMSIFKRITNHESSFPGRLKILEGSTLLKFHQRNRINRHHPHSLQEEREGKRRSNLICMFTIGKTSNTTFMINLRFQKMTMQHHKLNRFLRAEWIYSTISTIQMTKNLSKSIFQMVLNKFKKSLTKNQLPKWN